MSFLINIYSINIQYEYLTIKLRARDVYEVIVDEDEARINYHLIKTGSEYNLIVLVESEIKQNIALTFAIHNERKSNNCVELHVVTSLFKG